MSEKQVFENTRRKPSQPQTDEDAEFNERKDKQQEDANQRAKEQTVRDEHQAELDANLDDINTQIEEVLSANPQEFVIRFLQTEGQ